MTKRSLDELRIHPDADQVPLPDQDTYDQMVEDIAARGIQVPLDITDDGTILDGRTRFRIARNLGHRHDIPVRIVKPSDTHDYMIRAALMRRDLSKSQRAALALRLPEYQQAKAEAAERAGGRPSAKPSAEVRKDSEPVHAAKAAAKAARVSPRLVEQAEQVAREAPDLLPEVERGDSTVAHALERASTRLRETDPAVAESHRAMEFAKAMKKHGVAQMQLSAGTWADALDASDVTVMKAHLVRVRQWAGEWDKALDRPALRVVGGSE